MNAVPSPAAPRPRTADRLANFAPRFGRRHSRVYSRFVGLLKVVLPAAAAVRETCFRARATFFARAMGAPFILRTAWKFTKAEEPTAA